MIKTVALQMTSTPDINENLAFVEKALASIPADKHVPHLVVLPECFACFGTRDGTLLSIAEARGHGDIQAALSRFAKQFGCYLVGGTIPLKTDDISQFTASSLFYGPDGQLLAEYQKIHMFDAAVNDATKAYRESKYTRPGENVIVIDTPIGRIGMAVCYDVRFPGLFTAMGDVDILVLPAAFTQRTGEAHWTTLVRARAIEKQCFVVGANQTGVHDNKRETYGHSMIVSPWGEVIAEKTTDTGSVIADIDLSIRKTLKTDMPVSEHNRFRSHFV
ncbi:carbon-nitrogen hydrolase family protein [Aestuariibacter sp. A3R04]|uniref:carbon-nitrogen hydrolase family protein n=1 Tax=Aestuariibacter sp. A3R04 TaxID=2841571 RepID=UPI001C08021D|nr:carbon-nitrogen hydrolase family protein [Aestuariibacter sp. A3R04]MBU3020649.1 carbon-nitrogen hydrolase family protein [Aestuariibacter sp. A3R04]